MRRNMKLKGLQLTVIMLALGRGRKNGKRKSDFSRGELTRLPLKPKRTGKKESSTSTSIRHPRNLK